MGSNTGEHYLVVKIWQAKMFTGLPYSDAPDMNSCIKRCVQLHTYVLDSFICMKKDKILFFKKNINMLIL